MLWLYTHFPHLIVDHYRRYYAKEYALAIVHPHNKRILDACPLAIESGIKPGMSVSTAQALRPDLHLKTMHEDDTEQALKILAEHSLSYAEQVCLDAPLGIALEVGSMLKLFSSVQHIWQSLQEMHASLGYRASAGMAPSMKGARVLSLCQPSEIFSVDAPSIQDPDTTRRISRQIDHCPLVPAMVHQGFDTALEALQRMGIQTLGELRQLPSDSIQRRFGQDFLQHLQKIYNEAPDSLAAFTPADSFHRHVEFDYEATQSTALIFAAKRLLTDLQQWLIQRQLCVRQLNLNILQRNQNIIHENVACAQPEWRSAVFLQLIQLRLEQKDFQKRIHQSPVISISLRAIRTSPHKPEPADLFRNRSHTQEQRLHLFNQIQAKLGAHAAYHVTVRGDHRPESAWQPITPARNSDYHKPAITSPAPPLDCRPLWLLPTPMPLPAPPAILSPTPERIKSGWWDTHPVERDYYLAHLPTQQLAWVFRTHNNQWFIHGWFA